MARVGITQLYSLLSEKVGKETAENLTGYIESKLNDEVAKKSETLAAKQDISNLEVKISEYKSEIIKWMFIFWIGQVAATFGFILLYLKK